MFSILIYIITIKNKIYHNLLCEHLIKRCDYCSNFFFSFFIWFASLLKGVTKISALLSISMMWSSMLTLTYFFMHLSSKVARPLYRILLIVLFCFDAGPYTLLLGTFCTLLQSGFLCHTLTQPLSIYDFWIARE